jgi:hypothetical protein
MEYKQGGNVTLRDLLLSVLWAWCGPLLALFIVYLTIRTSGFWTELIRKLNTPVIKGKRK